MVPIVWLYIIIVVVAISFSIIVSCMFISFLLVTLGIMYNRADSIKAIKGVRGDALRYKPEGDGFDSRWCH
jgi:hypothetical protein